MKALQNSSDVYQIITDLIIEKLEQGVIPWRKPWNDYGPAVNYLSRKSYRGINQLILNGLHVRPFYLTFKQAKDLGGRIKKGSKSIPVTYWNFIYRDKETNRRLSMEEAKKFPPTCRGQVVKTAFLKYYRVFNIDDVQHVTFDIPELNPACENYSIESCDAIFFFHNLSIRSGVLSL